MVYSGKRSKISEHLIEHTFDDKVIKMAIVGFYHRDKFDDYSHLCKYKNSVNAALKFLMIKQDSTNRKWKLHLIMPNVPN